MLQRLRLYAISLLALFSFALLEKGLFALQHSELHQGQGLSELLGTLLWGFRFDMAISAILALIAYLAAQIFTLFPRITFVTALRWTTFSAILILILLHGADSLYYGEAGRHLGYELKEGFNSGAELALSALTTYALPVSGQVLLMFLALVWSGILFKRLAPQVPEPHKGPQLLVALLPLLLISATLVRGGVQQIPLEPIHAQRIGDSRQATLALNGAYNALYSSVASNVISSRFTTPPSEQQLALVRQILNRNEYPVNEKPKQRNVIFILLESWSGAYMAPYGHNLITTPNFDRLRSEGLTSRAMLAGGSRTTEGMFSTFCSAQNPLGNTVAQSQLQNYDYNCLPEVMRKRGWNTAFFQGTFKETSGTGAFAQLLGFEKSFGREDIDPEKAQYETHPWGYHDPDIYGFVLEKLSSMPRPFVLGINTDTTHDSQLPEGIEPLLPHDTVLNRYQNVLHFADASLDAFINAVQSKPGLANTIFVLVADHSGPTPPLPLQKHLIPFAIVAKDLAAKELNVIATQRDIAPTLLQLIGLPTPSHFTGTSLLQEREGTHVADYYHQGILGWTTGEQAVEFLINNPEHIQCYSLKNGLNTKSPTTCTKTHSLMQDQARAFTHTSQYFLFNGELSRFAKLN